MERSRLLRTGAMERMMYCMLHATGSKKELTARTYYVLVSDLLEHDEVQRLKQFRHHVHTTRFQHSLNVSYYSYWLCRRFHWDAVSAARAVCSTISISMRPASTIGNRHPTRSHT